MVGTVRSPRLGDWGFGPATGDAPRGWKRRRTEQANREQAYSIGQSPAQPGVMRPPPRLRRRENWKSVGAMHAPAKANSTGLAVPRKYSRRWDLIKCRHLRPLAG